MSEKQWFRWYRGAAEDGKFRLVARNADVTVGNVLGAWVTLLEDAAHPDHRGTVRQSTDFFAAVLDLDPGQMAAIMTAMEAAGLLTIEAGVVSISRWKERQFETDVRDPTNAERQRRYREKRNANIDETWRNGDVTRQKLPESDTDTDTEKKERKSGSPRGDLSPVNLEALRSRAQKFEQFWKLYPHKVAKKDAIQAFDVVLKAGKVPFEQLMEGLERYVHKTDDRPWCNPGTWLRQGRWEDQPASNNGGGGYGRGPTIIDALDEQREHFRRIRQESGSSGVDYQPDLGLDGGLSTK